MNLLDIANYAVATHTWPNNTDAKSLGRVQQTHCKCTLTEDGYRIYRDPNKPYSSSSSSTRTMWGGMILRPELGISGCLQTSHSYVITFDVRGQSSCAASDISWSNNAGWSSASLNPHPANIVTFNPVSANFNTTKWETYFYKWDIPATDSIYKVSQTTYSSFVSGNTYLSWKDFKFGYTYQNTGELGTDIYIKNIRMFDITNMANMDIKKNGVAEYISMIETSGQSISSAFRFGEIRGDSFYEI